MWYNPFYSIVQICATPAARHFRYDPKEAVPIEPKKERRISTDGVKPAAGAAGQGGASQPPKKKKKRRRSIPGMILRFIGCLLCVGIMLGSVGSVVLAMYVVQVTENDSEVLDLDNQKNAQTTILYDRYGNEYAKLIRGEDRVWRELSAMPEDLQHAVVAIEDKDFYNNPLGINIKRTIGAVLNELTDNAIYGAQQGASTLEQQLVKNLIGDDASSGIEGYMRKVREIFRAIGLANRYSKETILEAYLNTIPLTGIVCGMEAGAQEYFGKHVEDLTLSECAVLASISKSPTAYNPFTNPENLITRRNHVLYEMFTQGYITEEEYNAARAEGITLVESSSQNEVVTRTSQNSYFTDAVYYELLSDLQEKLNMTAEEAQSMIFNGGLRVYTTVDPEVQTAIEEALYDAEEAIPALWHEEPVCLRDYPAETSTWEQVQFDETTGLPLTADGLAVYGVEDIPIYEDEEKTTQKMGTSTDPNYPNDDTVYLCVYERVRTQAAITTMNYDGEILGIGGGVGAKEYDLGTNRATIPHQTGSTMKPIGAYCLALDYKLITYSTPIMDSPYYSAADKRILKDEYSYMDPYSAEAQARNDIWRDWPTNYGGAGGKGNLMLVYDALRQSYNTVAVRVGSMVGADFLYNFVHDTLDCQYIDAELDMDLGPLVLGSQSRGMTTVELAGAYSIFYDGTFTTPHYYTEITDYRGNEVLDNTKYINTIQAIEPTTAYIMNRMMANVLKTGGTASGMAPNSEGIEAVAKTGTTSDYRDYTFAGLTPYYVTTMWWGCDRPTNMWDLGYEGRNASPIQRVWKAMMEDLQADKEAAEFPMPDGVVARQFDTSSGVLVSGGGATGYYTEDNLPDDSYAAPEVDPFAELAQQAAEGATAATDPAAQPAA